MIRFLLGFLVCVMLVVPVAQAAQSAKTVLILTEGHGEMKNPATGEGRQLGNLLGHFTVASVMKPVADYRPGEMNGYDVIFYVGSGLKNEPPQEFLEDVYTTSHQVVWLNTGMIDFCRRFNVAKRFGFTVSSIDSVSRFDRVRIGTSTLDKGEPKLGMIRITNGRIARALATAFSSITRREAPYAVQARNLLYFGDSPFAFATPTDHYLFFADYLHEILGQDHESSHHAMIRIEDVTLFDDPARLREIADLLSSREIPFMVGVIPFFVDPGAGIRLSLSDKPELVDALQYMVRNGGTIVMHGVTHQYKGVTASDFEFWDDNTGAPIKGETEDQIARKLEMGIQEFMKNGIYPLVWETPHYTASFQLYKTVARYFSTACEQRLALEDADYSQYFPYVIKKDLFGQTIYPEDLGYVPLDPDINKGRASVDLLLAGAKAQLNVRDGISTAFFHAFLDLSLLERLVDGMQDLGLTFLDMREQTHWVKAKDRVILCGSQSYALRGNDQYLLESYFDREGEVKERQLSDKRLSGLITRNVTLAPGEFYKAELVEYRESEPTFFAKVTSKVQRMYESVIAPEETWKPGRVALLWNHFARGAAYNDQASFAAVFRSVRMPVDTIFFGQTFDLSRYNLVVVPFAVADSLPPEQIAAIGKFVAAGGNIIMDGRTDFAEAFGIVFAQSRLQVRGLRDRIFPEERIAWQYAELISKFDVDRTDKVFCVDDITEAPVVVGKQYGNGRILFINARFDPRSTLGTSQFPYLIEYVRRFFLLRPIVRREDLEVYFDPGLRHTASVENLVRSWVANGIRIVHVAGWHEYPKYTYDYERLIRLAHGNGILVYAWLEPPQVSLKFWQEHPEWQERNILGEPPPPSWRYAVALTDTGCVRAMTEKFQKFLGAYDWDGVNLAELYFESGRGLEDLRMFTPAHPTAKAELKKLYGVDLAAALDSTSNTYWRSNPAVREAIVRYRIRALNGVYHQLLQAFSAFERSKPGFEVIVTAMDSFGSPELREQIGVDMADILALQHEFGFILQVEDPQSRWSTTPRRYVDIGNQYRALVSNPRKLMLDLNILNFRKPEAVLPYPTLLQTGTESFQLIRFASLGAPRHTIYSEATVNPQDMAFLAHAMAAQVELVERGDTLLTSSPVSFVLRLPKEVSEVSVDGAPLMPFRDTRYLVSAGEHRVVMRPAAGGALSPRELQTRMLSATGNVLSLSYGTRDVALTYECETRMLVALSNLPTTLTVDGVDTPVKAMKGNDCYTLFLPPGRHSAVIVTGDQFAYGVNLTSFWSSTAIALFGLVAVGLLLGMYAVLKVLKRQPRYSH
jgi:uncharacterized protein YdaL